MSMRVPPWGGSVSRALVERAPAATFLHVGQKERIGWALLALRLSVFLVMLMWTLDKFFNPAHAAGVFEHFYGLSRTGSATLAVVAAAELAVLVAFVLGWQKRVSYGLVLLFHAISTLASYRQYLDPFENLLFFAAWPMLAACIALFLLRDQDNRWTVS